MFCSLQQVAYRKYGPETIGLGLCGFIGHTLDVNTINLNVMIRIIETQRATGQTPLPAACYAQTARLHA